MQAFSKQSVYYLRGDANALGGHLEEPIKKTLPTLAPVSLPSVGGFSTARSGAFNFEEIVSCSAAYTRVSGQEDPADGSSSILVAAVIEDLNILEVVRAERIVMQLLISTPGNKTGYPRFSLAGSVFEGLRLAGQECRPILNPALQSIRQPDGLMTWMDAWPIGSTQAGNLLKGLRSTQDGATYQWAQGWQQRQQMPTNGQLPASIPALTQCSLVDSLQTSGASRCIAHVVEIPGFGRIIFGELLISPGYIQLVGIRADLGCPVRGQIGAGTLGGGGIPCLNSHNVPSPPAPNGP